MRLELVTGNVHKREEFSRILAGLGCPFPVEVLNVSSVTERGSTYYQNAYRKARAGLLAIKATARERCIVMADDSGLELPAFGSIPGIYSARFEYAHLREREAMTAFLRDQQVSCTPARFVCQMVVFVPWSEPCFSCEGIVSGFVTPEPRGSAGFGYDPLFVPEGYSVTYAEMDTGLKDRISHRAVAAAKLWSFAREGLGLRP
ncbi:MAG: non-canonical purine NTP pyrophosphatase [Candidatus Cryosericum sp.]|nr:non-canonical purine NTP pyrophosphatase [bacterium]